MIHHLINYLFVLLYHNLLIIICYPLAPSAVNSLVPTANPFSICVAWNEPSDNGGQAIKEYKIERWDINEYPTMENFIFVTTVGSDILSYTIENLENDTEYRY